MSVFKLASRYAKSLMDIAIEKGKVEALNGDIRTILGVIKYSHPLSAMLRNPVIKTDKKIKVMQLLFGGKIDPITSAFLNIIFNKRREPYLADICEAFIELYNLDHGIVPVTVTTAIAPDANMLEQVKNLLTNKAGLNKIELQSKVDDTLIGGFVLLFQNKLYDNSVKRQLQLLSENLLTGNHLN
jgi:F-type H+-transporting ATPase subunit delta